MRRIMFVIAVLPVICATGPAAAQILPDLDFNTMMMNQTLGSQILTEDNMNRLEAERQEFEKRGAANNPTAVAAIPDYVVEQTQDAVMAQLDQAYKSRSNAFGKASADQWLLTAARTIGQRVGALGQEYLDRVSRQGQADADAWYVATAREISERYIAQETQ